MKFEIFDIQAKSICKRPITASVENDTTTTNRQLKTRKSKPF